MTEGLDAMYGYGLRTLMSDSPRHHHEPVAPRP